MNEHVDFTPLLIVSAIAVIVPVILHRIKVIRIPIIVGEILVGIAVGPTWFGIIGAEPNAWIDFLKLFGFAYLMFLSGLEIDFAVLTRRGGEKRDSVLSRIVGGPLQAGLLSFAVTFGVSILFARILLRLNLASDVTVMALVLSTTSLAIVAPVLREHGLIGDRLGQYTLVASTIGDFATVSLVSIYVILHTEGLSFEILFVLVLLAATFLAYRLVRLTQRRFPLERLFDELSHATAQLDTRGALALAVLFIGLAQGLGVEMILGAFMAGAIISLISAEEGSALRPKLHAIGYGFFIPIFFIMVGVDFDTGALIESPQGLLLVPLLLVMAFGVKYLSALVFRPIFGWREVFAIGTLTSARLSLIIAVAAIGVEIGAIEPSTNAGIIVVSILSVVVAPVMFSRIAPAPASRPAARVIIVGSTPHARLLAKKLKEDGDEVTVVTSNETLRQEMEEMNVDVVMSQRGGQEGVLPKAGIESADVVVSLLDDDEEAFGLTTTARERYGIESVVALVNSPNAVRRFQEHEIRAVDPSLSTLVVLEGLIRRPHAFSLLTETGVARHVADIKLRNSAIEGRQLRKVRLPGDALVMMIVRDGEVIIPRGITRLRRNDLLTIVGSTGSVQDAVGLLRP